MSRYLFVYGTLKSAFRRNQFAIHLSSSAANLGEARMSGRLYGLKYYPCYRLPLSGCNEGSVLGEVHQLNRPMETLRMLDAYEDAEYARVQRLATLATGEVVRCWVYCYGKPLPRARLIEAGEWVGSKTAPVRYRPYK